MFHVEDVKKILETVKQEEKLCDEVETVQKWTYLGYRVSAGGRFETRARCGLVKFSKCNELLYGRRFS